MLAMKLLEEAGPNTELSGVLLIGLGFFFLMVVVGWLTSGRNEEQSGTANEVASHDHEHHK